MSRDQEKWNVVARIGGDEQKIFRVRLERPDGVDQAVFSECVVIEWTYGGALPDPATGTLLQHFETLLDGLDDQQQGSVEMLAITGNGKREWCYYTRDYDAFMAAFNAALLTSPRFPIAIEHSADPDWRYWTSIGELAAQGKQCGAGFAVNDDTLAAEMANPGMAQVFAAQCAALEPAARRLAANAFKLMKQEVHDYAPCDAAQFGHLDLDFYRRVTKLLQTAGFDQIIDTEPMHNTRSSGKRVLMRFLLSSREPLYVALYNIHPLPPGLLARWRATLFGKRAGKGTLEFETEFSNGEFIITNTSMGKNPFTAPQQMHLAQVAPDSAPLAVLDIHRRRVAEYQGAHPGVTIRKMAGLSDIAASNERERQLKIAHRRAIDGISATELLKLTKDKYPFMKETVMTEMRRLIAADALTNQ